MVDVGRKRISIREEKELNILCDNCKVDILSFNGWLMIVPRGLKGFISNVIYQSKEIESIKAFLLGLQCNKRWLRSLEGYQLTSSIYDKR